MRIISGRLGGRQLNVPAKAKLRPTTDRVRTSLFDSLVQLTDFSECQVLDLYSGSGSLGFEALSRGASSCVFVERARLLVEYLQRTADELGIAPQVTVVCGDVSASLPQIAERWDAGQARGEQFVRLILADPPYTEHPGFGLTRAIVSSGVVKPPAIVAIGRPKQLIEAEHERWPDELTLRPSDIRRKDFGDTQFDIYLFT